MKIDQEFIKTLVDDDHNQKIVRAILQLAKSIGLETVAEGVEDVRTIGMLRELGCDYAQGYGVHRPAPSSELARFLEARRGATAASPSSG